MYDHMLICDTEFENPSSLFVFETDIDECLEAALNAVDLCVDDQNTQCSNREGSFECICVPGFARENGTCHGKIS